MMDLFGRISRPVSNKNLCWGFLVSFLLWCFGFRGYLSNQLMLTSDATAYYEHFRFYLDWIRHGIYPMWDPAREWGIPIDLFLRRIGSFNPLFGIIILLDVLGLSYTHAYLAFLAGYFFLGLIGFYLLALIVLKDRVAAFAGFLLLLFSALGTRLFDSYIILTFVPMIWFFYFLLAFAQKPRKVFFLGMTFTLMVIFNTYIPFLFLTIFLSFAVCFSIFYPFTVKEFLNRTFSFINLNRWFCSLCCIAIILSLIPGFLLFKEMGTGQITLPERHSDSTEKNSLAVAQNWITGWSILEDIFFSSFYLDDLRKFSSGLFYIPFFVYIVFFLGLWTKLNKRLIFIAVWWLVLFVVFSPHATPVYNFLYGHVFYFKYFRTLHFVLWIVLLPLGIIFLMEQLKNFMNFRPVTPQERWTVRILISAVHLGFLIYLLNQKYPLISSFGVLILSFSFFIVYFEKILQKDQWLIFFCLIILVSLEPLHVFHYYQENSLKNQGSYRDTSIDTTFLLPTQKKVEQMKNNANQGILPEPAEPAMIVLSKQPHASLYIGLNWLRLLSSELNRRVFNNYIDFKFVAYDRVKRVEDQKLNFSDVERSFALLDNFAWVSDDYREEEPVPESVSRFPEIFTEDSRNFQWLGYDPNSVRFKINLERRKFLVYNESFHEQWRATINNKPAPIWRANVAFKGMWVPTGESVIELRFHKTWRHLLNYFTLFAFLGVFILLIWEAQRALRNG